MIPPLNSIVSRLHVKHLRLLIALGERGSLLGAATRVGLTQSGASKALQEIETTLGMPLFVRTNRGLEANAAGRCAIRYAQLIHTDVAHLHEELAGIQRGVGGRLSVGAIMGAVPVLTHAVSQILKAQPDMSVEIIEDTSVSLLAQIDEGRVEMAICRPSVSQSAQLYDTVPMEQELPAAIVSAGHPLRAAKNLTLAKLARYRWIVYRANMPLRLLLEREFLDAGIPFPAYLLETTSALATVSLLQKNREFVAVMPTDVATLFLDHGLVCMLPLAIAARNEPYGIVTRRGSLLSPAASLLRTVLLEESRENAPRSAWT